MKSVRGSRKISRKGGAAHITPKLIETYRKLKELEALDLQWPDPRLQPWGEIDMLRFEINKALGTRPWETDERTAAWRELAAAAGDDAG